MTDVTIMEDSGCEIRLLMAGYPLGLIRAYLINVQSTQNTQQAQTKPIIPIAHRPELRQHQIIHTVPY